MNHVGVDDLLVRARSALLDALSALSEHRKSVIVIGAQAVYLHTGAASVALAEATKDSDLAVDPRSLGNDPLIEEAMSRARFILNPETNQPGAWISPDGIPVDLMVPDAMAGGSGRRSAEVPPHSKRAFRRAVGLEAAVIDHSEMEISALARGDQRRITARVAGPAALLVAKLHKIAERQTDTRRLVDKDAHDAYRLLVAIPTDELSAGFERLLNNELSSPVSESALGHLRMLFSAGADALGSQMAGRVEQGVGDPEVVSAACAALATDLINAVARSGASDSS